MKGLDLSREFYLEFGAPMIHERFPAHENILAVGLVGSGSECFGYDDDISQDHDFEPGFCIFVPDGQIDSRTEFALERAYASLPKEFRGYKRSPLAPADGRRHGVIRQSDFFRRFTGSPDGPHTADDWFSIPANYLAEATNGEIFRDDDGKFSRLRQFISHLPEDVRRKKLAGELALAAQSGQYNYTRSIRRSETGAAQLAAHEFVCRAMSVMFLLSNKYMPYYKWRFRALSELPLFGQYADTLEFLISSDNDIATAKTKREVIEDLARIISDELRLQGLSSSDGSELERHARSCNETISDAEIRNHGILYAVR